MTDKEANEVMRILWSFRDMRERLMMAQRNLEEVESMMTGITIDYSKDRVTSSPVSPDRFGDLIDKLSGLRQAFIEEANQYLDVMKEVRRLIDSVTDARYHELLCRRYLFYERWERIACEMNYDIRHVRRLHKRALEQVAKQVYQ